MFPRSPGKRPSGKLRLVIKPKTVIEVEASEPTPEPPPPGADDGVIKFKLPLGFTLDTNISDINSRQRTEALQRIRDVEDRLNKCKPCRKKALPDSLGNARILVNNVFDKFVDERVDPITIVVGHATDNSFKIDFTFKDLSASVVIGVGNAFTYDFTSPNMAYVNTPVEDITELSTRVAGWLRS